MKKAVKTVLSTLAIFFVDVPFAFADGNPYEPYNPYAPHTPLPTGFDDTNLFYITALGVFAIGMTILAVAKAIKKNIPKN